MFLPYKIKSEEIDRLTNRTLLNREFLAEYRKQEGIVHSSVNIEQINQELIQGSRLQEQWFPVNHDGMTFDVFISHSHRDINLIEKFASWMWEKLGLRCFIDSMFWKYADDLLKKLDDWYALRPNGESYSYKIRNYTTSHVHAMLSMALMNMMAKTECVMFVDSDNSITYRKGDAQTPSPWIYEEINFAQNLEMIVPDRYIRRLQPLYEQGGRIQNRCFSQTNQQVNIRYNVDLSDFCELTARDFHNGYTHRYSGNNALDYFHHKALEKYKHRGGQING